MRFDIRGSLGLQVSSVVTAHAIAYERNQEVTEIRCNYGHYTDAVWQMYPTMNWDYRVFEEVLQFKKPFAITECMGNKKIYPYRIQNAKLIHKWLPKIREQITLKPIKEPFEDVLHIRYLKDKRMCTLDKFQILGENFECPTVIADSYGNLNKFFLHTEGLEKSYESPYGNLQDEWLAMAHAKRCTGIFSAWSMSPCFINPNYNFYGLGKESCDYPENLSDDDWESVKFFCDNMENMHWVTL